MRYWTILILMAAAALPVGAADDNDRLGEVLRQWVATTRGQRDFRATIRHTVEDSLLHKTETSTLTVRGRGPDCLRIDGMDSQGQLELRSIWTKAISHHFSSKTRTELVYDRTRPRPDPKDRNWLYWFYFWLDEAPDHLPTRFLYAHRPDCSHLTVLHWKLLKEDEWYVYLQADRRTRYPMTEDWTGLVLNKRTWKVRQVLVSDGAGNRHTWDVVEFQTDLDPPVTEPSLFDGTPRDWPKQKVPPENLDGK
jgi:hypothetical protein